METHSISALVLAGGESRRMGRDKAWIEWQGRTLIERSIANARATGCQEVFISGRPDTDYSTLGCPVLLDLRPGGGPLGGIERGLNATGSPLLLVLAVDLPAMTPEFLGKLFAASQKETGVVPELAGELEPLAAIYPKRAHGVVQDLIAQDRRAARAFASQCRDKGLVRILQVGPADKPCFANWNEPA